MAMKGIERVLATSPGWRWCVVGGGWSVLGMVGALLDGAVDGGEGLGEQPGVVVGRQPVVWAGGDDEIVCVGAGWAGEVLLCEAEGFAESAFECVSGVCGAEASAYGEPEAVV